MCDCFVVTLFSSSLLVGSESWGSVRHREGLAPAPECPSLPARPPAPHPRTQRVGPPFSPLSLPKPRIPELSQHAGLKLGSADDTLSDLGVQLAPTTGPRFPHRSNKEDGFSMTATHSTMLRKRAGVVTDPEGTSETTSSCAVRARDHTATGGGLGGGHSLLSHSPSWSPSPPWQPSLLSIILFSSCHSFIQ